MAAYCTIIAIECLFLSAKEFFTIRFRDEVVTKQINIRYICIAKKHADDEGGEKKNCYTERIPRDVDFQ